MGAIMSDLIKRLRSQEAVDGTPREIELLTDEAADALEAANVRIAEFERILEGLPQDAIDGGWTARGISGYAKQIESRIAELQAQIASADMRAMQGKRLDVENLQPGQEFNSTQFGRARFIRWDRYMGERTAEIEKLDFGGRCNPLPEVLQEAIDEYAAVQAAKAKRPMTGAARDVVAERERQVTTEGWTPEHDAEHSDGSMAAAAACYAMTGVENTAIRIMWWKVDHD